MPNPILMRKGEFASFDYQVTELDETTSELVPVDLTGLSITYDLFRQVQQTDGSFVPAGFATGVPCALLEAATGWITVPMPETIKDYSGMFKITFNVQMPSGLKIYPRYANQSIHIIDMINGPTRIEGATVDYIETEEP
jgi:hypothetical protein